MTDPLPQPFDVLTCPLEGVNLVEASAGTGKTWNICGLYLRLLLERGLDVAQILVVTFTNAATAELRERVRSRIVELHGYVTARSHAEPDPFVRKLAGALEARGVAPSDIAQRLQAALQSFDEASILTIHGFCQRALAETTFAAGFPFALEIQPDDELRLDVVHDFWRRHIACDCPPVLAAWLEIRSITPDKLEQLLKRHLAKPLAHERWPAAIDVEPDLDASLLHAAYDRARQTWTTEHDAIRAAYDKGAASLNGQRYKPGTIDQAMREWDTWFGHGDALAPIEWGKSKLELLTTTCLQRKTKKNATPPHHAFFDEADTLVGARRALETQLELARLRLLRSLYDEAGPALLARKREARVASYDDLLQNLDRALHDDANGETLARSLRQNYPVALVDEFQDTDPVQFAIFDTLYARGGRPLFLVGDPKQAIYGFRNADLHTYFGAARNVRAAWTLSENQRSTRGLIAGINALFGGNSKAFVLDGIAYRDVAPGDKRRAELIDRSQPRADLCLWSLPRWADGELLTKPQAVAASARATAGEIARLLDASRRGEITLDGEALAPHDIAVLVRTHRQGVEVKQALAALGVGSVELSQANVFQSADAEDVARVLRAVAEPANAGLLRAALATELLGFDASAIAALDADEATVMAYVERFLDYRDTWIRDGVGVMYRAMLVRESVTKRMLARVDGERRLTNLLHLGELLHGASETHRAPDALTRWLDEQRRDDAEDEVAQLRLESDRNLVQIVTIHKAKGLEYPIVFCPFLWQGATSRSGNGIEGREYHDDGGAAVIDYRGDDELGDELAVLKHRMRQESRAEDLRLVYVALTRASHRCYLVVGCYGKRTKDGGQKETRCAVLNWLVAGNRITPDRWFDDGLPVPSIDDAWKQFAKASAPHVDIADLPMQPATPVALDATSPDSLRALAPPKRIPAPWRIGSFSALHDEAVRESAASDHDAERAPARATAAPDDVPADDILRFPRGVDAGDCLHAVFERADFADPSTWDAAIARALRDHPVALRGVAERLQQPLLHAMIARMLGDVLRTELPDGIRLDAVSRQHRLTELEFNLPAANLTASSLNAVLHALDYRVDRLTFARLDGYLKGFIDLVFEHRGRYYLLDWKSNHLGYTGDDYGPPSLAVAMAQHGYHLQSLLYAIALTRYLARRVPGYRHDMHFGGVLYLFVRGVRPTWRTADGAASGVQFDRPSVDALARFDAWFPAR